MQFHSSIVPIGLPLGVATGWAVHSVAMYGGAAPADAAAIAAWAALAVNTIVGGAKNLALLDVLSLVTVRPVSGAITFYSVLGAFARAAT